MIDEPLESTLHKERYDRVDICWKQCTSATRIESAIRNRNFAHVISFVQKEHSAHYVIFAPIENAHFLQNFHRELVRPLNVISS